MAGTDTRAVTAQISAVLLLGFLVIILTTYQATVVPDANRATEFEHSQQVIDEMQTLQADAYNSISTGDDIESTITLGTDYQSRLFAINPPPAAGTLRTTAEESIESDELDIASVCRQDGTTRALQYEANYREYRNAPTITYESSVLYLDFDGKYLVQSEQSLVSGDQLSLMPLEGTVSKQGTNRQSVRFRAGRIETTERTVGEEFNLTVPTRIPAAQWENDSDLLADELVSEGGSVKQVVDNETANGIDIRLESGDYDVQCRVTGVDLTPSTGPAEDGSGSGSGSGNTGESSVGQGGSSEFTDTNSETISSAGGVWTGITNVSSLRLRNPRFSLTEPFDGETNANNRFFRMGISITNDTTEYVFVINNLEYTVDGEREWQERDVVSLYKYEEGTELTDLFEGQPLPESTLDAWLDDGESIDLLDESTYENSATVEDGTDEVRSFLNSSEERELYITDMHGRTDVTLDQG